MKANLLHAQSWNPDYKTLNHWRGVAALWVMIFHGFTTTYHVSLHPLTELLKLVAAPGWLGVHIFFVISGYCISANVYKLILMNNGNPWIFIRNRAWRLLPVYWMSFLVTISLNLISSLFNKTSFWENLPTSWQGWIGNIFLIQPYLNTPFYVIVYWTMVIEIEFYLVITFLLVVQNRISQNMAILIGIGLGLSSFFFAPNFKFFLPYWGEFICGILLFNALFFKSNSIKRERNISLCLIFLLCITSIVSNMILYSNQTWISSCFALILYFIYPIDTKLNSLKSIRWLKIIGIMSYSLYLLHVPFQARVLNLGLRFISTTSPMFLGLQALGWAVAIVVSFIFYRMVEKPLNDWRHQRRLLNA